MCCNSLTRDIIFLENGYSCAADTVLCHSEKVEQKANENPLKIKLFGYKDLAFTRHIFLGIRRKGREPFPINIREALDGNVKHLVDCWEIIEGEIQIIQRSSVFVCEGSPLEWERKVEIRKFILTF